MSRIFAITILATIFATAAVIQGCAAGGTSGDGAIGPWVETSCTDGDYQHFASLLPGFVRSFEIAVTPTTRNMSTGDFDLEETVSQARAIGDNLHIILLCSFGDPATNLYDYRRLVDFADRASMGISLSLDIRSLPDGYDFSNSQIRQTYLDEVEGLVDEYPPDYFNLCMEMNAYALDDATKSDYHNLVSLYEEAYDLVEYLSPNTVTYCSHSWELDLLHVLESPVSLLTDLGNRLDAAGISTFPQLAGIEEPSEIPGIYFQDLPHYVSVPIIVECGFSDDSAYGSSEAIARDFPPQLIRALGDLNLSLIQLVEMHDLPATGLDPLFHQMGLRRLDGSAKPIYCGWQFIADSGT